ncbi:MAG: P1 family peptidase [Clostridia bacterium]|nr:P1 family peptidase [Clostridia bacterium]
MKNEFIPGRLNKISDVPGVTVGHKTIDRGEFHTGVTVINPTADFTFQNKPAAASFVLNGYGKSCGLVQIDELGTLESPIALTNTLSVGTVLDGLARHNVAEGAKHGMAIRSVNSVVCECNDGGINDIESFGVTREDVEEAFTAATDDFAEGAVGAGRGMVCHGLKGGIGSASRIIPLDGVDYTLGVLLLSNHGALSDLTVDGDSIGQRIANGMPECDKGSIIVILATDIPLTDRQIKRVLKRISTALARVGSRIGHGSGEVFIGFSTGNRFPTDTQTDLIPLRALHEDRMDLLFRAVSETTEDALLKSMLHAAPTQNREGDTVHSLAEYV